MGKGFSPIYENRPAAFRSTGSCSTDNDRDRGSADAVMPSTSKGIGPPQPTLSPSDLAALYIPDAYRCALSSQLQRMSQLELNEDDTTRTEGLDQIRSWIRRVDYIKDCRMDANFLLRFLRVKKFNVGPAFDMLTSYILMRQKNPAWFHNLSLADPKIRELIDLGVVFALPDRDHAGRRVIFTIGGNINPKLHSSEDVMRTLMFVFEVLLDAEEENQIRGFAHILDESDLRMAHLRLWRPMEIKKVLTTCEKSMPMRHKKLDFVSLPPLMHHLYEIASRVFISAKLRSRITLHKNRTALLDQLRGTDPKLLPAEYGGVTPMKDMISAFKEELRNAGGNCGGPPGSTLARVAALDRMRVDEEKMKRAGGIQGSLELMIEDLHAAEDRALAMMLDR